MATYPNVLGTNKATLPLEYEDTYPVLRSRTASGNIIRKGLLNQQYRTYTISYNNVYRSVHDTILTFHKERLGGYEAFDFEDPYSHTLFSCIFSDEPIRVVNIKNYIISFKVSIQTLPGQDII